MKVFASVAVSLDGYIDDTSTQRLVLSGMEDRTEVKKIRAEYDAILVGAETVRRDNPSLRSENKNLVKVTVSHTGNLDVASRFFAVGDAEKIVIVGQSADEKAIGNLRKAATVIKAESDSISSKEIIHILEQKGIKSLFIEGGTQILTMFLTENAVDYLRVAIAPFFVGETEAPRFTSSGKFPFNKNNRMNLVKVSKVGDMAVMEYDLRHCYDYNMLEKAVELSKKCPKSNSAYSVGAVIVTNKGEIFEGYSRETEPHNHAEEEAILKAEKAGAVLENATIYSSMEPCSTRKSKPISCSEHIIKHKMSKVVFAFYEPDNFVICNAKKILEEAGIEVVIIDELAEKVKEINAHILK